jgi:hypothetical protein
MHPSLQLEIELLLDRNQQCRCPIERAALLSHTIASGVSIRSMPTPESIVYVPPGCAPHWAECCCCVLLERLVEPHHRTNPGGLFVFACRTVKEQFFGLETALALGAYSPAMDDSNSRRRFIFERNILGITICDYHGRFDSKGSGAMVDGKTWQRL